MKPKNEASLDLAPVKAEGQQIAFDADNTNCAFGAPEYRWYERAFTLDEYAILAAALQGNHPIVMEVRKDMEDMAKGLYV